MRKVGDIKTAVVVSQIEVSLEMVDSRLKGPVNLKTEQNSWEH